jgi:hypothetical protein
VQERDEAVRADILILRSLANLDATILDHAMLQNGMNLGLLSQKHQAVILWQQYEGIVALATRLGDSWDEALMLTRATASQGSGDPDTQVAYDKLMRDTAHLYGS